MTTTAAYNTEANRNYFGGKSRWTKSRDKYGRTVRSITRFDEDLTRTCSGVIVNLPKGAWQLHDGAKYLVNDWRIPGVVEGEGIRYFHKLSEAYAYFGVGNVEGEMYPNK